LQSEQHEIGIVCGQCDAWSPMGTAECQVCSNELALFTQRQSMPRRRPQPRDAVADEGRQHRA
jgi:hypothetical protein